MKLIRYKHPLSLSNPAFDSFFGDSAPSINRFESVFEHIFGGSSELNRTAVDLYEDTGNFFARLELPGIRKEDVDLELENTVLRISVSKAAEGEAKADSLDLKQSIAVPEGVALKEISARLEDGILTVTMPKEEVRKPFQIEVN
ncbi:MAG: Hsp20/alpha crystallin family protein [Opitutaceae bacterium]